MLESLKKNEEFNYEKLTPDEMKSRGILGRLIGPCADIINPTRNGRRYPEELWDKVFHSPLVKEQFEAGGIFGELTHPDREEVDIEKIAIVMPEAPKKNEKGLLIGRWDILDTPAGRILKTLCDYGYKVGISTRGSGDTFTDYDGQETVDADSYTLNALDIVTIPAVKAARLNYMTESYHGKSLQESLKETLENADDNAKKIMSEALTEIGISLDNEDESKKEKVEVEITSEPVEEVKEAEEVIIPAAEIAPIEIQEPEVEIVDNSNIYEDLTISKHINLHDEEPFDGLDICVNDVIIACVKNYSEAAKWIEEHQKEIEEANKKYKLEESLNESLDKATPYMLRNDGVVINTSPIHPYIKMIYEDNDEKCIDKLINDTTWNKSLQWFYDNTQYDAVREEIKSFAKSLISCEDFNYSDEDIKSIVDFDYDDTNFVTDKEEVLSLYKELNDLMNQEFCKVRTSDMRFGGTSGDIYFRISSVDFDWFDIIWNFVENNKLFIESVTICKDTQAFGGKVDFLKYKNFIFNNMPVDEFLTLEGSPIIENYNYDLEVLNNAKYNLSEGKSLIEAFKGIHPIYANEYFNKMKESFIAHNFKSNEQVNESLNNNELEIFSKALLDCENKDQLFKVIDEIMNYDRDLYLELCDIYDSASSIQHNAKLLSDCVFNKIDECLKEEKEFIIDSNDYINEDANLNEQAMSRGEAISKCSELSQPFVEHFDKIYNDINEETIKHHGSEMQAFFDKAASIELAYSNRIINEMQLYDWFITDGRLAIDLFDNETEAEVYDDFAHDLLNTDKNVLEALKRIGLLNEGFLEKYSNKSIKENAKLNVKNLKEEYSFNDIKDVKDEISTKLEPLDLIEKPGHYRDSDGFEVTDFIVKSNGNKLVEFELWVDEDDSDNYYFMLDLKSINSIDDLVKVIKDENLNINEAQSSAVDNNEALVEELQNNLKHITELENKVVSLQEKLSVCYAKESKDEAEIAKYKKSISKLSEGIKKVDVLNTKLNLANEELAKKDNMLNENINKINSLEEKIKLVDDRKVSLNESLSEKDTQIKTLTEKYNELVEANNNLKESTNKEIESLNESIAELNKDNKLKQSEYSHKLEKANKLIEKYKAVANSAVDRYIESASIRLGVSTNDIKNRLPESYSFDDIDEVCDNLQDYNLNISKLPFRTLKENIKVQATPSKNERLVPANMEDDVDEDLLKLAGM